MSITASEICDVIVKTPERYIEYLNSEIVVNARYTDDAVYTMNENPEGSAMHAEAKAVVRFLSCKRESLYHQLAQAERDSRSAVEASRARARS